ncbi:thiamine pyrophosphate-binding protein [Pseudomonadota bacterium]|nr:thiamine pyrophosphate-binding protein [Pseudomonadota bacterium]
MNTSNINWQNKLFQILKKEKITIFTYVPDAGHKILIDNAIKDNSINAIALTSEQEGIGIAAGAYLGGSKAVLLMQSSGVGNCINQLSLIKHGQFPFLTIITMRGEYGEGNPWQYAMGEAVIPSLNSIGVQCLRINNEDEVESNIEAALTMVFKAERSVAVLLSQKLIGAKSF